MLLIFEEYECLFRADVFCQHSLKISFTVNPQIFYAFKTV